MRGEVEGWAGRGMRAGRPDVNIRATLQRRMNPAADGSWGTPALHNTIQPRLFQAGAGLHRRPLEFPAPIPCLSPVHGARLRRPGTSSPAGPSRASREGDVPGASDFSIGCAQGGDRRRVRPHPCGFRRLF